MIKSIPILLYHSINERSSSHFRRWVVSPQDFDRHLAYLRNDGYVAVTVSEIASSIKDPGKKLPDRVIAITFDDGFEDFYTQALPILEKYQFLATIYIATGYVDQTSRWLEPEGENNHPMLRWWQIKELDQRGIEIGAHSMNHYHLDTLPLDTAFQEIYSSKRLLEQHLGHEVGSFAYPHGYYSKDIQNLVKRAGFTSASAVKHGLSHSKDDPYALARIIISNNTSPQGLRSLLKGEGLLQVQPEERIRTRVWRAVRRMLFRVRGYAFEANEPGERDTFYGKPSNHP